MAHGLGFLCFRRLRLRPRLDLRGGLSHGEVLETLRRPAQSVHLGVSLLSKPFSAFANAGQTAWVTLWTSQTQDQGQCEEAKELHYAELFQSQSHR